MYGGRALTALILVLAGLAAASCGPSSGATATDGVPGTVVQGVSGSWTDITPDTLASLLAKHDLTLINVKTPYIGEIDGTDLYIPYTELKQRAAALPSDMAARVVVYCRSGGESAIAAQTLLDLGYSNVLNLAGGMNAWVASGRALLQVNRS